MALPIEPTPTLTGEDAEAFYRAIENLKYSPEKEKFLRECREFYLYHAKRAERESKRFLALQKKNEKQNAKQTP